MSEEAERNELAKAYDPSAIEAKWAKYWADEKLFDTAAPAAGDQAKAFTMLLPPPNVTGRLHMGHMLNQTEMDILARWHRMSGERSLWVPGTDHASNRLRASLLVSQRFDRIFLRRFVGGIKRSRQGSEKSE